MKHVEPEPMSGCWLWTASTTNAGYGKFGIGSTRDNSKKVVDAHRFSYKNFVGDIPEKMCVLHKCDVKTCVNPDHLFIGTIQNNSSDMAIKGRGLKSKNGFPYGAKKVKGSTGKKPYESAVTAFRTVYFLGNFPTAEEASKVAIEFKNKIHNNGGTT